MKRERSTNEPAIGPSALAIAIERGEWERIMLHIVVGIAEALRSEPQTTIDDLLTLLEANEVTDDR